MKSPSTKSGFLGWKRRLVAGDEDGPVSIVVNDVLMVQSLFEEAMAHQVGMPLGYGDKFVETLKKDNITKTRGRPEFLEAPVEPLCRKAALVNTYSFKKSMQPTICTPQEECSIDAKMEQLAGRPPWLQQQKDSHRHISFRDLDEQGNTCSGRSKKTIRSSHTGEVMGGEGKEESKVALMGVHCQGLGAHKLISPCGNIRKHRCPTAATTCTGVKSLAEMTLVRMKKIFEEFSITNNKAKSEEYTSRSIPNSTYSKSKNCSTQKQMVGIELLPMLASALAPTSSRMDASVQCFLALNKVPKSTLAKVSKGGSKYAMSDVHHAVKIIYACYAAWQGSYGTDRAKKDNQTTLSDQSKGVAEEAAYKSTCVDELSADDTKTAENNKNLKGRNYDIDLLMLQAYPFMKLKLIVTTVHMITQQEMKNMTISAKGAFQAASIFYVHTLKTRCF